MRSDVYGDSLLVRRLMTAALLDSTCISTLDARELDLTIRLLRRSGLLGRIAGHLAERGLLGSFSKVVVDQMVSARVMADARARVARWELDRLAWVLGDDPELPLVAMKGCAYLLAGTPNARGRMFADADLLVPAARLTDVESRLKARGWGSTELTTYDDRYYRLWTHELPPLTHAEREVEVDLHHTILPPTARLNPQAALLFETARSIEGSRVRVLAPVDMVLHAMTHLFYGGDLADGLRELVDIDDLLRHFGEHESGFWEGFWTRVEALDLSRPAFYGLRYAQMLLGTPIPEFVIARSQAGAPVTPVIWLMDRLVPCALFPENPEVSSRRVSFARWLLYVRSHWVKMPPLMLVRHLAYKASVRLLRRGSTGEH